MQKCLSYFLAMLLFTMLFIPGMSFSSVAQTSHPAPPVVKQSKSPVKPAGNKNKKALNDEGPVKNAREEEDILMPDGGGNDNAASTPFKVSDPSSTELWLLLAALVILPAIPFVFVSKKYSGDSSNRIKKFQGWLKENKGALQGAYITGFVVILFIYALFFKNYGSSNDAIKSYNDSIQKQQDFIKDLNDKIKKGFRKPPKQQRPGADSSNNKDTNF